MQVPPCYLSLEGFETVKARAAALGEYLAGLRALRATAAAFGSEIASCALACGHVTCERRAANGSGDRRVRDRRGLWTVETEGQVVIPPAPGVGRFDDDVENPTAFQLDDAFRGVK